MTEILLSASVPLPDRDRRFFESVDVLSIREAIKALVEVILPVGRITCGGHPAITPLLGLFVRRSALPADRITIFQSAYFPKGKAHNLEQFLDIRRTRAVLGDRERSLTLMREEMVKCRQFSALVIIGGMEGIFEERDLFAQYHPGVPIFPIASTGAAAGIVFGQGQYDPALERDLTYSSLFRRQLLPQR